MWCCNNYNCTFPFMKSFITIISILLLTSSYLTRAQDYVFNQLTVTDGLSQSTVFAIFQDSKGYMWFGTIDGLNRYDGYHFKIFVNDPSDSTSISDNFISALFEDSESNLWIGTVNGYLNKYDRITGSFKRYYINNYFNLIEEPAIEYYEYPLAFSRNQLNSITSIEEDKYGYLWIGTWGNGVVRLNKETNEGIHFFNVPNDSTSLAYNRITDILKDKESNLWIATFGAGICRAIFSNKIVRNDTLQKVKFLNYRNKSDDSSSLSDDKVITLFEDNSGNIWTGTFYGGLNKLNASNKLLTPAAIKFIRYKNIEGISNCLCNNTVMCITQDNEDYLWIGTFGGGLDKFDIKKESFTHFSHDPANESSLPDNDILSLYIDRSGIIWVGSHLGEGITKLQKSLIKFNLLNSETNTAVNLNDNVVWSVYKDEKDLWVGTYRGGVNRLNLKQKKETYYTVQQKNPNSISNNHIRCIKGGDKNTIWFGTYNGGLNRLNKISDKVTRFLNSPEEPNSISANQVQDILIESDTVIWIATFGGGINKLSFPVHYSIGYPTIKIFSNNPQNPKSLIDDRVYRLYKDSKNNFWVGTYGGGLELFDTDKETFTNFRNNPDNPNSLSNNKVISILEDSKGVLWIGTSGGGLNRFNYEAGKFKSYSINEGLTSATVYGILEDENYNLWLSSDGGIFKFNINSEKFIHFGLDDGVQSLEFSGGAYFKDSDGMIYFGGINGLNYFYPDSVIINSYISPVVINSIKIFNDELSGERDEIILSHDQNFISFEFASLDYTNPRKNKYSYILSGLQKEWQSSDASVRTATYTNLPAGEYLFKVTGTNSDGVWNESGTSIKLIITPPFWQTWWFVTFIILVTGYFIYYVSTIRVKNQLAIEKLKTKIASDLHDNVGAGLTEISILSEVASQRLLSANRGESNELKNISDIARELVDNMSDIVWVVNPQRDSLYDLIIKLKDSYNEFLNSVGISFQVKNIDKTNNVHLSMDYKQNLLLMFKEAINNAIKHSRCSKIVLEANIKDNHIEMILEDDGIGFDESDFNLGNGMRNMENRAKKLKGSIKWNSELNKGTIIHFVCKISKSSKIYSFLYD